MAQGNATVDGNRDYISHGWHNRSTKAIIIMRHDLGIVSGGLQWKQDYTTGHLSTISVIELNERTWQRQHLGFEKREGPARVCTLCMFYLMSYGLAMGILPHLLRSGPAMR